jgi:dTDP-4-amino-4,6-dideoxygalactose transaminase
MLEGNTVTKEINMKYNIPFIKPNINASDIDELVTSLKSGWLAYGDYTLEAERRLKTFFSSENFTLTSSCTASLQLSLILAGVGPGDEVITTPLSWVATSNVVLYQGAKVVFADVDSQTGLIDRRSILEKVTEKTKAVIVVDLYGLMFDIQSLRKELANDKIFIIEDAAHSIGSRLHEKPPGSYADFTCFSFHAAKNITSGQGGGIICSDNRAAEEVKLLRRDGVVGKNHNRKMTSLGYKFDSTDFQSALLLKQIDRYHETHESRKQIYKYYTELFADQSWARSQKVQDYVEHSCHMYVVWLRERSKRDYVVSQLNEQGIQVSVHYNPIHLEPYYKSRFGYSSGVLPASEEIGLGAISLPTYPTLSKDDQEIIYMELKKLLVS